MKKKILFVIFIAAAILKDELQTIEKMIKLKRE